MIVLLVVVFAFVLLTTRLVALRLFEKDDEAADRAVAAALFALVLPIGIVRVLGAFGLLRPSAIALATLLVAAVAYGVATKAARVKLFVSLPKAFEGLAGLVRQPSLVLIALAGIAGLLLATIAAALLPLWAWDALSYHLPIVYDALQTGWLREVPTHVLYVNGYPRHAELFLTYVRGLLPNDDLFDSAQLPFAMSAVVAIAALARRAGATLERAASYGLAFLAIPLVSLQLATNYVEIAYAAALLQALYFVTAPLSKARIACAALAIGLLLGIKPTAPPAVALLSLVLLARSFRAGLIAPSFLTLLLAALWGGESYLRDLVLYGNPIWPIAMKVGPIALEGPADGTPMFTLGLPPPYVDYGWLRRLLVSLFVEPIPPIFDMRLGGFGPGFALLVLLAGIALWRSASLRPVVALGAVLSFAMPAAHWLRYSLAFPGVLLAASACAQPRPSALRRGADVTLGALLFVGLWRALPGFTGEGPPLWEVARMPAELRERVMVADGPEGPWVDAKARLQPGEAFAYDGSLALPGRLARSDGATRIVCVPPDLSPADARAWADAENVRLLAMRAGSPIAESLGAIERFRCSYGECAVYERPR